MKIRRIYFVIVALGLFWNIAIVAAQDQAPAPTFKEGDTWQFSFTRANSTVSSTELNDGIYEIVLSQGKVKLYSVEGTQKTEITIYDEGPTQGLLARIGMSKERVNVKFPLSVGQKWNYSYREKSPGAKRETNHNVEVSVTGIEQVTTPAGTFKAYKLISDDSFGAGGQFGSTSTFFYSPETRSVVKQNSVSKSAPGTSQNELLKFTPGS